MENFKQATKEKLRFQTAKGPLSTEQLWSLSIEDLDALAVSLDAEHKQSGKKSFLVKTSIKDKTVKLKFDVVIEVLNSLVAEVDALAEAKEIKDHNEKIFDAIAEKEGIELKSKSVKQLKSMLR